MESNSVKSIATSWTGIAVLAVLVAILLAVVPASFDSDAEGDNEYLIYIDLGGEVASKILFDETVVDYGDPEWVTVTADSAKNAFIAACEQKFGEGSLTLTSSGYIETINGMSGNGLTYFSDQSFTGDADQYGITYYPVQFIMEGGKWTYASTPIAAYEGDSTTFAVVCQPSSMDTEAVEFTFEDSAYAWDYNYDHEMYMSDEYDLQSIYDDYFVGVYGWEYGTPSEPYIAPSKFKFYIDLGGTVSGFFLGTDSDYGAGSWVTVTASTAKDALALACDQKFGEGSLIYKTTKYGTSIDTINGMSGNGGSMKSEQAGSWDDVYFYPVQFICEDDAWRQAEVTIPNYLGTARIFAITFMPLTFDAVEHTFADEGDQAVYDLLKTTYAWPGYGQFGEPFFSAKSVSVSDKAITIAPEDTYQLTATVNPYTATNKGVTWYSYDESIATVDENGLITAVAVGTVNIEVTSDYGSFTATTAVTVKEPVEYNIYIDLGGEIASAILLEDEVTDYGDPEWITVKAVTAKDALILACEQKFGEGSLTLTSSGYIETINGMSGNGLTYFSDQSFTGDADQYGITYYPVQFIMEGGKWTYASTPIAAYDGKSTTFAVVCQPSSMDTEAVDFTFSEDGMSYAMSWDTFDMYRASDGYDLQSIYDDYFVGVYGWEYGTPSEPYFAPVEYQIYIDLGGTVSAYFLGTEADYGEGSWETVTASSAKDALALACDQKFGEGSLVYKTTSYGTSIDTINGMSGNGGSMKSEQAGSWDDVYFYPVQFICEDDAWRQAEVTIPNYLGTARIFAITFMPLTFDAVEHTFADEGDQAKYELLKTTYAWPGYGQFETPFISLSSISVEESEVELNLADQYEIEVVFEPADATNQNVTYSSSDPAVAIVTVDGVIQPMSAGTTEITVTSDYGSMTAKIDVTVVELKVGESFESEGIIYSVESVDPNEVVVVGYEGAIANVEIPEYVSYKGYDLAVTEIATKAFYGCKTLKSIDLGNVTKVGVKAFVRCSNLESVNGGDSLVTISAYAFFKCTKLASIDLYDAAETLRIYGSYAFYGCDNLGEIIVPSFMTHITSNAFTLPFYDQSGNELEVSADSLKGYPYANINAQFVQQPVAAIGTVFEDDTFEYTISSILPNFVEITGYVGSSADVLVNEKVAYEDCDYKIFGIGEGVFKDNKSITSIVAPDVRSVGKSAFYGCSHLKVTVLPGAEKIGVKAFAYCRALEDIEIDSLKNVQAYTFYRCTSLDTVVLNGITNIGTAAFYQCTSLEIVDLGDSVAKVLKNAFTGCNKLELVEFSPTLTWISSSAFGSTEFQDMDGNTVSSAEDLCGKTFIGTDGVLTETVPDEDD